MNNVRYYIELAARYLFKTGIVTLLFFSALIAGFYMGADYGKVSTEAKYEKEALRQTRLFGPHVLIPMRDDGHAFPDDSA